MAMRNDWGTGVVTGVVVVEVDVVTAASDDRASRHNRRRQRRHEHARASDQLQMNREPTNESPIPPPNLYTN
jgi:hypothetical protein